MRPAKQSPRLCDDGTLRWYCGDTFLMTFVFTLKDSGGHVIEPLPTDEITLIFKDYKNEVVAEFSSVGVSSIDIAITDSLTEKFPEGVYSIVAKFNSESVTTLLHNSKVVVE